MISIFNIFFIIQFALLHWICLVAFNDFVKFRINILFYLNWGDIQKVSFKYTPELAIFGILSAILFLILQFFRFFTVLTVFNFNPTMLSTACKRYGYRSYLVP